MALERKIRRTGRSLVVTVPGDFTKLYDIERGDLAVFEPVGTRSFKVKIRKGPPQPERYAQPLRRLGILGQYP